jgi:hypothetical protein
MPRIDSAASRPISILWLNEEAGCGLCQRLLMVGCVLHQPVADYNNKQIRFQAEGIADAFHIVGSGMVMTAICQVQRGLKISSLIPDRAPHGTANAGVVGRGLTCQNLPDAV